MLSRVKSFGLYGLDGYLVDVEVDISNALASFEIVGLPDAAVKESKERVRSAIKNSNFSVPNKRIVVNLAPANYKKIGSDYDLPMAIAILSASGQLHCDSVTDYLFIGELALNGELRKVSGILPMIMAAKNAGITKAFVPNVNVAEASVVDGVFVYGADNLEQIVNHLMGTALLQPSVVDISEIFKNSNEYDIDFSDVKGQDIAKRAVEVAIAGNHNIILIGSPGSGKSMIAKRIPTILPDLTFNEALETTKIHSIAGNVEEGVPLITTRPFRNPHHSASAVALGGGGTYPKPGEISLAHNGVLFMDELPEFRRDAIEVMRQPLEDGTITISRINGTLTYPCNTLFVASMNPCKCGYFNDPVRECSCTPAMISRYISKISGPMLDRIDLHIEVNSVRYDDLSDKRPSETSAAMKSRIVKAREIQAKRYQSIGILTNSQLNSGSMKDFCALNDACDVMLKAAFENMGLSARAKDRIVKVARTIADLEASPDIQPQHIAEAVQYRSLDRKYWHSSL